MTGQADFLSLDDVVEELVADVVLEPLSLLDPLSEVALSAPADDGEDAVAPAEVDL